MGLKQNNKSNITFILKHNLKKKKVVTVDVIYKRNNILFKIEFTLNLYLTILKKNGRTTNRVTHIQMIN